MPEDALETVFLKAKTLVFQSGVVKSAVVLQCAFIPFTSSFARFLPYWFSRLRSFPLFWLL